MFLGWLVVFTGGLSIIRLAKCLVETILDSLQLNKFITKTLNQNLFFYSNHISNATPNCCLQSPTVWLIKSHFKELWSCEKRATHEK